MTLEEALALPAGPELDALVATKVMGWTRRYYGCYPSTDIAAAWEVVENLASEPGKILRLVVGVGGSHAQFPRDGDPQMGIFGPTTPLAICRAALKACWGDE